MDATRLEIFWTQKLPSPVPHARIATAGGILPTGRWEMLESEAVHAVALRRHTFFVRVEGGIIDVIIGRQDDRWYLKGVVDSYAPKTLLSLPDGPPSDKNFPAALSLGSEQY